MLKIRAVCLVLQTDLEMGAGHTLGKLVEEWNHHLKNKFNFAFYTAKNAVFCMSSDCTSDNYNNKTWRVKQNLVAKAG